MIDHRERIDYWGYLAIHETAKQSKEAIANYYGSAAQQAYFSGCSTGGHQALMAAQRYPDDFDGIIAGAPGNNRTALNAAFLWQFIQNHAPNDDANQIIPAEKLPMITEASVAACDGLDGVVDGIIDDPRLCNFDPSTLLCEGPDGADCLTAAQVDALEMMYQGPRNPRTGEQIYPGFPVGSEGVGGRGWSPYWADPSSAEQPARVDFWRYWVFEDPHWNWWSFDWDYDYAFAKQKMGPLIDAMNPDLSAFEASGGKLILYHGWADPVVSGVDTADYYEAVTATMGSSERTEAFARLFMAPGMAHCGGGPGPSSFDVQTALERWVEHGEAPDSLLATRSQSGEVVMSRPLCPYPQVARYLGQGSTDDAANFACVTPE